MEKDLIHTDLNAICNMCTDTSVWHRTNLIWWMNFVEGDVSRANSGFIIEHAIISKIVCIYQCYS